MLIMSSILSERQKVTSNDSVSFWYNINDNLYIKSFEYLNDEIEEFNSMEDLILDLKSRN